MPGADGMHARMSASSHLESSDVGDFLYYSPFHFADESTEGVRAQTIHQWPSTRVQLAGSPLSLNCTVKGTSSPSLYWYRQEAGGSLQLLFYSVGADQIDPREFQNFEASRPQDGQFTLSSKKLQLSNSGFYLCAWSLTLSWVGQTSVQKPHPLPRPHHPLQKPSLRN